MKKLFFIIGMHRSGTSALTRVLNLAGIDIGDNLMDANFDNPKGFFEDNEAVEINDSFMRACDSNWCGIKAIDYSDYKTHHHQALDKIRLFLENRFAARSSYGLKDPRLCRTLPLWQQVLEEKNIESYYILAARNPLEVAESLKKRNGFPESRSIDAWLRYSLDAEKHTRTKRRAIVSYDSLLNDPLECLTEISQGLQISLNTGAEVRNEINSFLDQGLRHSDHTRDTLEKHPSVTEAVIQMYLGFQNLDFPKADAMDRWSGELDKKYPQSLDEREGKNSTSKPGASGRKTLSTRIARLLCNLIPSAAARRRARERIKNWPQK